MSHLKYKSIFKLLRLLLVLLLVAHWGGCMFFYLCKLQTPEINFIGIDRSWCDQDADIGKIKSGIGRWWYSMYIAFLMMTGENIEPTTTPERIYMISSIVIGHVVTAVIIGNVSVIISDRNSETAVYQRKLDAFQASAQSMHLPATVIKNVEKYYELLWNRHRTLSHKSRFIGDLNPALQTEIAIFLNRDLIATNPLFSRANDGMILSLVRALENNIYLKGSFMAHKGEMGNHMYFLVDGEACAALSGKVLVHYKKGAYFGEISLLLPGHPRACDLICISDVETRELHFEQFQKICFDYPDLKAVIIDHLKKQNNIDEHLLRKCEASVNTNDLPSKINTLEHKLDSLAAQLTILTKHVMATEDIIKYVDD